MTQEHERYEGISEDRTVEVIMESSYVLEALRAPVFVDDLGDFRAVGRALLEAWQERVPGFGVDMQISHGSGEAERLCSVGIVVQWIAAPEDDFTSTVSRQGIAAIKAGEDPWDAYMLAVTRASWLWGLEAREMTPGDQQLKALLTEEPRSSQTRGASPAAAEVEEEAAATSENQNTQGRRDRTLPAIPGFPSKAKYQVSSGIDLDLTSGRTTYQL